MNPELDPLSDPRVPRQDEGSYEDLRLATDPATGAQAIVCVHDTTLGPALGGIRVRQYGSEAEAVDDVMRLARAMTFKAAAAGLALGGGKAVVVADPHAPKPDQLLAFVGRLIASLHGRYIGAQDAGLSSHDLVRIAEQTPFVVGLPQEVGGSGDPSPMTALGVLEGMRACLPEAVGTSRFEGLRVSVQGCGQVGSCLALLLAREGARLTVADVHGPAAARVAASTGARVVPAEDLLDEACDVLAPCALGEVLTSAAVGRLCDVRLVAGAANNPLESDDVAGALHDRGILYAPDFIINSGGLISVADELRGFRAERARREVMAIGERLRRLNEQARRARRLPLSLARELAIHALRRRRGSHAP